MFDLINALFFAVGLMVSIFALTAGIYYLTSKTRELIQRRNEDARHLISILERIEENTRHQSDNH